MLVNLFTNFSLVPLQLVSAVGLLAATAGLLGALAYLMLFIFKSITVPGYASIIISILVMVARNCCRLESWESISADCT